MAKKKRRRKGGNLQATAFKLLRIGALVAPAASVAMGGGTNHAKISEGVALYTGYSIDTGRFMPDKLARGWGPFFMACLATYGIPKLMGIIRRL